MRLRRALALLGALGLAAAGVALAQPPTGIVRPTNEASLSDLQLGQQLYAANCATCHGTDGRGVELPQLGAGDVRGQGPPLRGVGAATADFYLRTGRMPLRRPEQEPERHKPLFGEREIRALVAYVASLGPGPPIPRPHPELGNVALGLHLFTEHCAGCHQVVTQGGIVTGARVPPLQDATPTQTAEAVRIGPYLMPKFSPKAISDDELNSIIAYVEASKKPQDTGGWGIGHIGPIPEGMVAWLLAAALLVAVCVVIGERRRE